jgi:hypothetical protein
LFLCAQLVDVVVNNYSDVFPELRSARNLIHACITEEETSFSRTLLKGIDRFKKQAEALKKECKSQVCVRVRTSSLLSHTSSQFACFCPPSPYISLHFTSCEFYSLPRAGHWLRRI